MSIKFSPGPCGCCSPCAVCIGGSGPQNLQLTLSGFTAAGICTNGDCLKFNGSFLLPFHSSGIPFFPGACVYLLSPLPFQVCTIDVSLIALLYSDGPVLLDVFLLRKSNLNIGAPNIAHWTKSYSPNPFDCTTIDHDVPKGLNSGNDILCNSIPATCHAKAVAA